MDIPHVSKLRWTVTLAKEQQVQSTTGTGLTQSYANQTSVYAGIEPTGLMVWLDGVQTEINAITHRIYIRWRAGMNEFDVVLRDRIEPGGATVTEVFRIHRWSEVQGRQRYIVLDAELRTG